MREMDLHRPAGDEHPLADLRVCETLGDELDHLQLRRGEAVPAALGTVPRAPGAARASASSGRKPRGSATPIASWILLSAAGYSQRAAALRPAASFALVSIASLVVCIATSTALFA